MSRRKTGYWYEGFLGLRYLLANMGPLQPQASIQEFVIGAKTTEIVEKLLALYPPLRVAPATRVNS